MKKHLKIFLFISLFFMPFIVNAKVIDTINIKGIVAPVAGAEAEPEGGLAVTVEAEGLTPNAIQWQSSNGGVISGKFLEGTTYELYIGFDLEEGYELSENLTITANEEPLEIEHYSSWIGLIYRTPGVGTSYTLSFETNGGNTIDPISVEEGDFPQIPADPYKEGHTFAGWYTDSSFKEEFNFVQSLTADTRIYAKWTVDALVNHISSIKISGIELPLGGEMPSTNAYIDTKGLTTDVVQWETTSGYVLDDKFELGKKYQLFIGFSVDEYYEVNDNAKITANFEPDSYEIIGNNILLYYTVKTKAVVPFEVKSTSIGGKNIKLSWNKKDDAKGYIVYSSTNNKKWKKVTTIKKNSTLTYNVKKLKPGTKYYFKVVAYKTIKKKNKTIDTTKVIDATTTPSVPKVKVKASTYNSVTINIGKVKGASEFVIERSTDKKNYVSVDHVTKTGNYKDTSVETGTKYYYRVRACNGTCSKNSKVINAKPALKKPTLKLKAGKKKVNVTLKRVTGASGYVVERSTKKNNGYSIVMATTTIDMPFEDISVNSKKTYYYRVRAYRMINGKTVFSPYSKVMKVKVK